MQNAIFVYFVKISIYCGYSLMSTVNFERLFSCKTAAKTL